jgi:hypothetical protein
LLISSTGVLRLGSLRDDGAVPLSTPGFPIIHLPNEAKPVLWVHGTKLVQEKLTSLASSATHRTRMRHAIHAVLP